MSKVKRTLIFILAVITCMTFCLVNSSAEWKEFVGPEYEAYLNSGSAKAWVRITNWAQEENKTDLEAKTYVYPYEYTDDSFYSVRAYVELTVTLDEGTSWSKNNSASSSDNNTYSVISGQSLLNTEDHYGIIGFTSEHGVYVTEWALDEYGNDILDERQDGNTVYIGTSS